MSNDKNDKRNNKGQFTKGNQTAAANRYEPPPGADKIVESLASKGCSEISIAKGLGVSGPTWQRWRDEYPELLEAWQKGRAIEHDKLFNVLFRAATKDKNIIAAMFLLKARHGYRENADFTVQNKVSVTFEVPGALNPDVYEAEVIKKAIPKSKLKELTHETKRT